jgi:hypothetical protein
MVIFGQGEEDKEKYEGKDDKKDEFKKAEDDSVFGGLMGFLFIPILGSVTFTAAFIGFQYCMSYNVTLYAAKEELGRSCWATCWKFLRVIRGVLLCQTYSRDGDVLIRLSLTDKPPITNILTYVYGSMDAALCAQAHTINPLINDGLVSKSEAPTLSLA